MAVSYTHLDVYKRQGHVQVRLTVIWLVALIFLVIGNYLPKSIGLATKNHNQSSKSVVRKLGYLMIGISLALLISLCFNPYTTIMAVSYTHLDVYKRQR